MDIDAEMNRIFVGGAVCADGHEPTPAARPKAPSKLEFPVCLGLRRRE
jgi:hypothetical protein